MSKKEYTSHLDEIALDNSVFVENYCNRILRNQTLQRNKKRTIKIDDEVDVILENSECEMISSALIKEDTARLPLSKNVDHFTSPEAKLLFNPKKDETVIDCLARQISMLTYATKNDDILVQLTKCDNPLIITTKGRQYLRMQFIYLRKAYELLLQYMNSKTWAECYQLCIDNLEDNGINYLRSKVTLTKWNREFRVTYLFINPFNKGARESKLF